MKRSTLYSYKYKWGLSLLKAKQSLEKVKLSRRPVDVIQLSHDLYRLGARGEELWDYAFAAECSPEYHDLIADNLQWVETMSAELYALAEEMGIRSCRKYLNLKCPRD